MEYVFPDEAVVTGVSVEENFPRLRGQLAWSTLVFDQFILRATWHADYLFDAPTPIRDLGRELNHVLQAWALFPIHADAGLMVKYKAGRRAPDYLQTDHFTLGLTVSLQ